MFQLCPGWDDLQNKKYFFPWYKAFVSCYENQNICKCRVTIYFAQCSPITYNILCIMHCAIGHPALDEVSFA